MPIITAKFKLEPNNLQKTLINKTIGCARFVYNEGLAYRKKLYETEKKSISKFDSFKRLPELKKQYEWLKEVDSTALQASLDNLQNAYNKFFKEHAGFPRFKSKKRDINSYTTKIVGSNIRILDNKHIVLPKLGKIRVRVSKQITGTIKTATVTHSKTDKYYVSIAYKVTEIKQLPQTGKSIGIDFGLKSFITYSNGLNELNPMFASKAKTKIAALQRSLSRKQRGSKRYEKALRQLNKAYEHVVNQRRDYLHKLTRRLIKAYDIIAIEDLDIKSMMSDETLPTKAEKIFHYNLSDSSWCEFKTMLLYKASWYGKRVVEIERFYPSSQLCSKCCSQNPAVKDLTVREWVCPTCGATHNRDINAAINILNHGLELLNKT